MIGDPADAGAVDAELAATGIDVLTRHRAHFINRFGAWSKEEVRPWRGPMPEIP